MKKNIILSGLMAFVLSLTSCNFLQEDETGSMVISSKKLTEAFLITPRNPGNNNITITTSPSCYFWVYDAETDRALGSGTTVNVQVIPPAKSAKYYIVARDMMGNTSKSDVKSIDVNEYTDLPEIYNKLFKINGKGDYTTTYWTWNTEATDGVWGNGGYMESVGPAWFVCRKEGIKAQAEMNNLPKDGLDGWFGLSLQGVTTSRGETGSVTVTEDHVKEGWDVGSITFSGTIPLLGIAPNDGKKRQYSYRIIKISDNELRLCAPDPGAGDWGTAWFWNFKRIDR